VRQVGQLPRINTVKGKSKEGPVWPRGFQEF